MMNNVTITKNQAINGLMWFVTSLLGVLTATTYLIFKGLKWWIRNADDDVDSSNAPMDLSKEAINYDPVKEVNGHEIVDGQYIPLFGDSGENNTW